MSQRNEALSLKLLDENQRIAPEKVGKPLVVEGATTMIVNGVTTEALKLTFYGEREILIPSGKTRSWRRPILEQARQQRGNRPHVRADVVRRDYGHGTLGLQQV